VTPPDAPTITGITTTYNSAALTWTTSAGATAYVLQYKKSSESEWTTVTPAPTGSPTTIPGLNAETMYNFRMQASNTAGSSSWTTQDATTDPLPILNDAWLRDAIANAKPGDIITFDTSWHGQTIALNGTELYIDKNITINAGNANVTIDANEQSRVFNVAAGTTVELVGLTITGGKTSGNGGGILNAGVLTLNNCVVKENEMEARTLSPTVMSGGFGGGIYNRGELFVYGGKITDNKAPFFTGGGLYNEGIANLDECTITGNSADWGGGVANTNYGTMTITSSVITNNTAERQGGGLANAGTVWIDTFTFDNIIENNPDDFYGNGPINLLTERVIPHASSLNIAANTPTYEVSGPTAEDLFEKTLTHWEFLAVSSNAIMDWEINFGDGSEAIKILGGPRSRVSVSHYFQEPGTYTITVKTTDFNGIVATAVIGTYTVKERVMETVAIEDVALIEPVADILLHEEPAVSFATWSLPTNESRFTITESYLAELAETMRQRQMLDLDGRNSGQTDNATFTDLIWSDDELFGDEWIDFTEQTAKDDFWNEIFDEDLFFQQIAT